MGRVKSKDTGPELIVRRLLHRHGYRFCLHRKDLPGTPDVTLPRHGKVIFVHGCFWHGHGCKEGQLPNSNIEFWREKISKNTVRDQDRIEDLKTLGWKVLVLWTCQIKDREAMTKTTLDFLQG